MLDYLRGMLSPEEEQAVRDHLDACPRCAGKVAELGDLPRLLMLAGTAAPAAPKRNTQPIRKPVFRRPVLLVLAPLAAMVLLFLGYSYYMPFYRNTVSPSMEVAQSPPERKTTAPESVFDFQMERGPASRETSSRSLEPPPGMKEPDAISEIMPREETKGPEWSAPATEESPVTPERITRGDSKGLEFPVPCCVPETPTEASPPSDKEIEAPADSRIAVRFTARAVSENGRTYVNDAIPPLRTGDKLKVRIEARRGGYVYLLLLNASGQVSCLFPQETASEGVWLQPGAVRELPGGTDTDWYTLSAPAGEELLCALSTEHALDTLDTVRRLLVRDGDALTTETLAREGNVSRPELYLQGIDHRPRQQ